jgi:hypothetical protein
MEEEYAVGAVRVTGAIRFYTVFEGQQAACEKELAKRGLSVILWARAPTEHEAMAKAMQLMALQTLDRT